MCLPLSRRAGLVSISATPSRIQRLPILWTSPHTCDADIGPLLSTLLGVNLQHRHWVVTASDNRRIPFSVLYLTAQGPRRL